MTRRKRPAGITDQAIPIGPTKRPRTGGAAWSCPIIIDGVAIGEAPDELQDPPEVVGGLPAETDEDALDE